MNQSDDLKEMHSAFINLKDGIYPLSNRYKVLKEISYSKKVYKRGDYIILSDITARKVASGTLIKSDEGHREESLRKIRLYVDVRIGTNLPEVTISADSNSIKIKRWD